MPPNARECLKISVPSITWVPRGDITTYELAQALPVIAAHAHSGDPNVVLRDVEALPPEVRRHFKVEQNTV